MRILYIDHYAGSKRHGMEFRPFYLAREWVRSGHEVCVVAASFSHVRAKQPQMTARVVEESMEGVDYRWYATPRYDGNGIARARNIGSFLRQLWWDTNKLVQEKRPDVVIASSTYPMDIWPARRIALKARAKLVFEVHDLWPLSPIELSGMSANHPFIRVCGAAESAAYRDSDVVVSMLPKVADYMATRGLDLRKLCIVPNGISTEEWRAAPVPLDERITRHLTEQRQAGRAIVGYAGSHGVPNALDTLLDAAARSKAEPVSFVLVGDGLEKEKLLQRTRAEGLDNVAMFAPVPKEQIPAFLAAIDIAYIGWNRSPIYRFGIAPNKLMDYMMAECAIVHSVDAGNDPVAEAGCGITLPPLDPDAIVRAIAQLLQLTEQERREMGKRGREYVMQHHTYEVLARRFLEAVAQR